MIRPPKVSVLVPGYRTDFLHACLDSAVAQSWSDLEIVVGDDCPHDGVRAIVAEYASRDARVRYLEFEGSGGRANFIALFQAARGEYIKYLNDDDLLHPRCVERMLRCLQAYPDVELVTSHRQRIDAAGAELADTASNRRIVPVDSIVDGRSLIEEMLAHRVNLVGEPSSAMFRRSALSNARPDIMSFGGRRAASNGDVSMWVTLLSQGNAIYLTESLSSFRQHDGQRQRDPEFAELGRRGWEQLCNDAGRQGLMPRVAPRGVEGRALGARPWWPAEAIYDGLDCVSSDAILPSAARLAELLHDDPEIAALHGLALTETGSMQEGRELLTAAVDCAPWDPVCRRALGLACWAGGDLNSAWVHLCLALAAKPEDAVVREVLARMSAACEPVSGPEALQGKMDSPVSGGRPRGALTVAGWVLVHPAAIGPQLEIEVSVDGRPIATGPVRACREDVHVEHPALAPFNPLPGFRVPLLPDALPPGEHWVRCTARCGPHIQSLGEARIEVLDSTDYTGDSQ